jgi:hypothetical protein
MQLDPDAALRELRWTRSDPPGLASDDAERRSIYVAALQQFEELLGAARQAGPATKALPLFYALSQAGRAIVAAHGEFPRTFGHGLGEVPATDGSDVPLLHREVKRRRGGHDTFGAVAAATRSGDFDGRVELGAAWVANPNSPRVSLHRWRPDWRLALLAQERQRGQGSPAGVQGIRAFPFCDPLAATSDHADSVAAGGRYPSIPESATTTIQQVENDGERSWRAVIDWPECADSIDSVAPEIDGLRYLIPSLPGQTQMLSPLMLWWVLLFGFSIYARYHPELWVRSLDVDSDADAVGVERILEAALDHVPGIVYSAAIGSFNPTPFCANDAR